jgi:hypothetical protein
VGYLGGPEEVRGRRKDLRGGILVQDRVNITKRIIRSKTFLRR